MLAFELTKYHTQHDFYAHANINIYKHDGYKWTKICKFTWQNDKDNDMWYAFHLESATSLDHFVFPDYVKFLQKVEKAEIFGKNPETVISWLNDMRGMKQLFHDNRMGELVTVDDYEKTRHLDAFKIYVSEQYIWKVLAHSENHAETVALKAIANGELYNWKTYLRDWNTVRIEKVYADFSEVPTIEEFLTPIWNK